MKAILVNGKDKGDAKYEATLVFDKYDEEWIKNVVSLITHEGREIAQTYYDNSVKHFNNNLDIIRRLLPHKTNDEIRNSDKDLQFFEDMIAYNLFDLNAKGIISNHHFQWALEQANYIVIGE
jgi:hypothetical protein